MILLVPGFILHSDSLSISIYPLTGKLNDLLNSIFLKLFVRSIKCLTGFYKRLAPDMSICGLHLIYMQKVSPFSPQIQPKYEIIFAYMINQFVQQMERDFICLLKL